MRRQGHAERLGRALNQSIVALKANGLARDYERLPEARDLYQRCVEQEGEIASRAFAWFNFTPLYTDSQQPVFRLPGSLGELKIHGERLLARGALVVVVKIIDKLFDANRILRRKLVLVKEPAHIRVGGRVHIDGKRR